MQNGLQLMSDEKVIIESKTHWAVFAGPPGNILVGVLLVILGFSGINKGNTCLTWIGVLGWILILGGFGSILPALSHPRTEFVLTDRRIIASKGLLRRHSIELLLSQVKGVEVTRPILGSLINYGTIILLLDTKKESFHNIAQAAKIKEQISSVITGQV